MSRTRFYPLSAAILIAILCVSTACAAPVPKGGFGFRWDDMIRSAEERATRMGMRLVGQEETAYGVKLRRFEGSLLGFPAKLTLRFYQERLYDVDALLSIDDEAFFMLRASLEDVYGVARQYYGIASDYGATDCLWRFDPAVIALSQRVDGVRLQYSHYQNAQKARSEMRKENRQRLDDLRHELERGAS